MTWRCTQCHRTRTDVPVFGICPCGGHGFKRQDEKPPPKDEDRKKD